MTTPLPSLTLYRRNGACTLASHILLTHLNIPFTEVIMDIGEGGLHAADGSLSNAEYRKIHHSGYIPALVVDAGTPSETVVTESAAVLTYLAALGGPEAEARLLGRDALRRGQTAELLTFTSATIHGQGYGSIWRPLRFTDDEAAWSGVQAKGRAVVEWAYGVLEQKLAGRPAAAAAASGAGDGDVGVADIYAYVFWRWGVELGLDMKGKFPRYYSVAKRVEGLASVQKTLQVEELAPLAA